MPDSPRKVKSPDRRKLREQTALAALSRNLYYQVKRVRGVI
jgi:hypothetical protein